MNINIHDKDESTWVAVRKMSFIKKINYWFRHKKSNVVAIHAMNLYYWAGTVIKRGFG